MAVFYNYIKGCGKDATVPKDQLASAESKTYTRDSWSFLKWTDKLYYTKDSVEDFKYFENNPIISFNNQPSFIPDSANNPDASSYSTGRILTSAARGQYICYDLSFKDGPDPDRSTTFYQDPNTFITRTADWTIVDDEAGLSAGYNGTILHFYGPNSPDKQNTIETGSLYKIEINNSIKTETAKGAGIWTYDSLTEDHSTTHIYGSDVRINGSAWFNISNAEQNGAMLVPSNSESSILVHRNFEIDSSKYCQAGYFNATSDARAKENIRKADFSALSIVNSLPIYNFNYKDSEKPSIGVIAQEAAEFNVDDFSLVENIEATGENNDYMSIKESKLIYILWKAIQEQQKEIEELKSQLRGDK